ncbi:RDD family protein [Streptomyces sp.]|uniref:RDD family protein n=1 Tax=Streptomyces sp. TaxID=1931 RepID=UPI002F40FD0F
MSTDQPNHGSPDDPFAKRPENGGGSGASGGSPYDRPPSDQPPGQPPPGSPYGGGPYGAPPPGAGGPPGPGEPYAGGPSPLAGMPPLAEGGKRVLARVIDIVIVLIPAALLDWAVVGLDSDNWGSGRSAAGGAFTAVLGFVYEWSLSKSAGQTVGKRVMKLRAAMLADGSVPTSSDAAVRALVLWLPAFCCSCFWFVIIGLTVLFDKPYKQGLHDKAAKTVVVRAD